MRRYFLLLVFVLVVTMKVMAQKYNFVNYSIDNGLVQSQANNFCRDNMGHLWVTTMGGVSCYDGKNFKNYTTSNGLISNLCYAVVCDSLNNILISTDKGISVFNGKTFTNYVFQYGGKDHRVMGLVALRNNEYMVLAGFRLFNLNHGKVTPLFLNNDTTIQYTALAMHKNAVYIASFRKGLYLYENNNLQNINYPEIKQGVFVVGKIEVTLNNRICFLTNNGIYELRFNDLTRLNLPEEIHEMRDISCLATDEKQNIWIGTFKGALVVNARNEISHYNSSSGCTDNRISSILSDQEGNIWLASDGQGVFRYAICPFTYYDETNGLPHPVVMSIVKGKDESVYVGTYGGGLVKISKNKIEKFPLPSNSLAAQQVLTGTFDSKGVLWIGTQNNKIWKFDGSHYSAVENYEGMPGGSIAELFFDDQQRLWVATPLGFGYVINNKFKLVKRNEFTWSFLQAGPDSVMITTMNQIHIYTHDSCYDVTKNERIRKSDVTGAMKCKDGNYWLMTNGYGILVWNLQQDSVVTNITTRNGLNSDFIYNLKCDKEKNVWVGTGAGINKINMENGFSQFQVFKYGKTDGMFGQESNKSAVMQNSDGRIWFGTTKGLYIYDASNEQQTKFPGSIILQSVKLFSQAIVNKQYNDSLSYWYNIPVNLNLPYTENHLTFTFAAVSFANPDKILYQYMIEGLEKVWSEPSIENTVIYPSLPPGKYVFKVRVSGANTPMLEYPFEIASPYYATLWFRLIIVASLILIGVGIQGIRNYLKKIKESELQKLREEEQNKVRQRTAEDFHDEVGNKLTRISLLADILKSKTDNEGIIALTDKIKDNTNELYTGTKDIIWALNPENDNLSEMLLYLQAFGNNLVQDSEVKFNTYLQMESLNNITLPMGYNRNITMIFKEAINNALKHGHCTEIMLNAFMKNENQLEISLSDDGIGLDANVLKKGNGMQNMLQRSKRINGALQTSSNSGKGTTITLTLNIPK